MTTSVLAQSGRPQRRTIAGYFIMPVVLLAALGLLWFYVDTRTLDSIEARSLNLSRLVSATIEHVGLTAVSTSLTLAIAVPLGIIFTREWTRSFRSYLITLLTLGQARSEEHTSELQSRGHLV